MTEQDQDAAIGCLVERYSQAKAKRAALLAAADALSKAVDDVVRSLRCLHAVAAFWDGREDGNAGHQASESVAPRYPDHGVAVFLLDDLRTVSAEIRECRKLLADAGVPLD